MMPGFSILIAAADGPAIDLVIWVVAGVIWFIGQMAGARRRRQRKSSPSPAPPSSAESPEPRPTPSLEELTDIFRRLGAEIPATPPPSSGMASPPPPPPGPMTVTPVAPPRNAGKSVRRPRPQVRQEMVRRPSEIFFAGSGIDGRAAEARTTGVAIRHTGTILPRLHAISLHLGSSLPGIPMPGLDRTHHAGSIPRTRLHSRRELRESLTAQMFLQRPKGFFD